MKISRRISTLVLVLALMISALSITASAAEGIMYGNWVTAALGIPWNIGQAAAGAVIAVIISQLLRKTSAVKFFTYK